jgi:AcrR family transcriptional regulator
LTFVSVWQKLIISQLTNKTHKARPSQDIDQALLASGRGLYPLHGCTGLSVRQICDHARVKVGMFHYHFHSKNNYLSMLLQGLYDEVFVQLEAQAAQAETAIERLREALCLLGRLMRNHGTWIGRVWADAGLGEDAPRLFLQRDAPRHTGLLLVLLQEAAQAGDLTQSPPMQRFGFLMGSVIAPLVLLPAAIQLQFLSADIASTADPDIFSDAAIADRVNRALAALALPAFKPTVDQRETP